MKESVKLNKLPQELINQIAAGEVIERPSSIVKELVDNSIDAQATKITIKIVNGGIDLIEISDNGIGIPEENLSNIFDAHTTSKISSFEDLNNLLTMGFRGEALSTIVSIANIKLISKYQDEDIANEITFKSISDPIIKKAAREEGTSISVANIFENVPARKKFLKTPATEYRKILDILTPYFLIYPNIHFVLIKNSKEVHNLPSIPNSKAGEINKERAEKLLKEDFVQRTLKLFYDGGGIKISGIVSHPSDHMKRGKHQYIFVNRRNIWDNSIARAVHQAYERYIPHGEKVPFIINIDINPDLVDVNVHPRKEEVRFLNPYRVYSAVEEAIKQSLTKVTTYKVQPTRDIPTQPTYTPSFNNKPSSQPQGNYQSRDILFDKKSSSVNDSLLFSKELLSTDTQSPAEVEYKQNISSSNVDTTVVPRENLPQLEPRSFHQIFNKYIIVEFPTKNIWVIDQHAAAERITFEKLRKKKEINTQNMLVPFEITLSESELEFINEHKEIFTDIGFNISITDSTLNIHSVPTDFIKADLSQLVDEVLSLGEDIKNAKEEISRLKDDLTATMACHTSVRSGQYLRQEEMKDIYNNLLECDNPYSCPHGRPAVWKMTIEEIDSNFDRTY